MEDRNVLERILAGSEQPRDLPLSLLETITDGFSKERKIGQGGFAEIYKGVLQNGNVAVKRIGLTVHTIDDTQFKCEVQSLLKIRHPNIVRFLGFCSNAHHVTQSEGSDNILVLKRERLLCLEYFRHGSLDKHITDELRGLAWSARYQIIKGICEGLRYLHEEKNMIHMDLKPANIMVDDDMVPKIADFGLARLDKNSHTASKRFRSRWYCAPEYDKDDEITVACDMYSLGVIIMELITGDRGSNPDINSVLRRWKCRWKELVRRTSPQEQQVSKWIKIAESCMQEDPKCRPSISDVIHHFNENGNTNKHNSAVGQVISSAPENGFKVSI